MGFDEDGVDIEEYGEKEIVHKGKAIKDCCTLGQLGLSENISLTFPRVVG